MMVTVLTSDQMMALIAPIAIVLGFMLIAAIMIAILHASEKDGMQAKPKDPNLIFNNMFRCWSSNPQSRKATYDEILTVLKDVPVDSYPHLHAVKQRWGAEVVSAVKAQMRSRGSILQPMQQQNHLVENMMLLIGVAFNFVEQPIRKRPNDLAGMTFSLHAFYQPLLVIRSALEALLSDNQGFFENNFNERKKTNFILKLVESASFKRIPENWSSHDFFKKPGGGSVFQNVPLAFHQFMLCMSRAHRHLQPFKSDWIEMLKILYQGKKPQGLDPQRRQHLLSLDRLLAKVWPIVPVVSSACPYTLACELCDRFIKRHHGIPKVMTDPEIEALQRSVDRSR